MMDTTYTRIKKLRTEMNLSQAELAKRVGYSDKTAIAKVEAGKVDLPQSKVIAFAKALNTTTSYLMGFDSEDDTPDYYIDKEASDAAQFLFDNPDYKVLFDATRKVKKEDILFVKEMIDRMSDK